MTRIQRGPIDLRFTIKMDPSLAARPSKGRTLWFCPCTHDLAPTTSWDRRWQQKKKVDLRRGRAGDLLALRLEMLAQGRCGVTSYTLCIDHWLDVHERLTPSSIGLTLGWS